MLHEKAMKVVEEANELKEVCVKTLATSDMVEIMSSEEFELYQRMLRLMDDSMNLVLEQCKMFDDMDDKLDKIMKKLEV
jgi:hypothetical protein